MTLDHPPLPLHPTLQEAADFLSEHTGKPWSIRSVLACVQQGGIRAYGRADRDAEIEVKNKGRMVAFGQIKEGRLYPLRPDAATALLNGPHVYLCEVPTDEGVGHVVDEDAAPVVAIDGARVNLADLQALVAKHAIADAVVVPAGDHAGIADPRPPVPRKVAQREAILTAISNIGRDPKSLPPPNGKVGTKHAAWELCKGRMDIFVSRKTFDTAWQTLLDDGAIATLPAKGIPRKR